MKTNSSFFLFLLAATPLFLGFNIEGKVRLEGKLPSPDRLEVEAKHQADCGKEKLSPKLMVSPEGGVANTVVWIEGVPAADVPTLNGNYTLNQIHCEFSPHILLIPKGAELNILNSDGFLHNVRAFDETALMLFNDAMPKKGQVLKKRFNKSGRILIRCGVHPWMHAIVVVQDHPYYALTDEKGHFKIAGVPEGVYTIRAWHESLGELREEITPQKNSVVLTYS